MARIDYAMVRRLRDDCAPQAMRGARYIEENLGQHAHRRSPGHAGKLLGKFVGRGDECGHALAAAHQKLAEGPVNMPPPLHVDVAFQRLHAQQDHRLPREPEWLQQPNRLDGMRDQRDQQVLQPQADAPVPGAAAGKDGRQHAHGVGLVGIAHGLDVGVFVDVDARADGHALRQIVGCPRHTHPDERLGIRAHVPAELVADLRQRAFVFQIEEQFHRSQR